jgi:hypothetical protein
MKVLYLIGNGFDLNLGLNTSFEDFFEYYKNTISDEPLIQKLKENIKGKKKDWSDLEIAFGEYTKKFNTLEEFDLVFDNLKDELAIYLIQQQNNFDFEILNQKTFFNFLGNPESYLLPKDKNQIKNIFSKFGSSNWSLEISTFNYTSILDILIGKDKNNFSIGIRQNGQNVIFKRLVHIHGYLDNHMVLGVNDVDQIGNFHFKNNPVIINSIVKDKCNESYKLMTEQIVRNQISRANLIVIFGSSIGDTDKIWWEFVGKRLTQDCILILFKKGVNLRPRQEHKIFRYEKEIKNHFLEKTNLTEIEKSMIEDKIFIGLNTSFLDLIPPPIVNPEWITT